MNQLTRRSDAGKAHEWDHGREFGINLFKPIKKVEPLPQYEYEVPIEVDQRSQTSSLHP